MPETMEPPIAAESKTQLEEVFKAIVEHAGAKTVYGEPVSVNGKTVLPVATIRYGFGGSSGGRGSTWEHGGGGPWWTRCQAVGRRRDHSVADPVYSDYL